MRIRTIKECIKLLKEEDPDMKSAITETGLRRLVKEGKIPSMKVGRKTLINYDNLKEYFK